MTREQQDLRWRDIPTPIRNIGMSNPLVYDLCNRYVAGQIITLEELLCQIIVGLNTDWDKQKHDYLDLMQRVTAPGMS